MEDGDVRHKMVEDSILYTLATVQSYAAILLPSLTQTGENRQTNKHPIKTQMGLESMMVSFNDQLDPI